MQWKNTCFYIFVMFNIAWFKKDKSLGVQWTEAFWSFISSCFLIYCQIPGWSMQALLFIYLAADKTIRLPPRARKRIPTPWQRHYGYCWEACSSPIFHLVLCHSSQSHTGLGWLLGLMCRRTWWPKPGWDHNWFHSVLLNPQLCCY